MISELRQIGDKVTMSEPRGQARLAGEAQPFVMDALEAAATQHACSPLFDQPIFDMHSLHFWYNFRGHS